PKGAKSLNRLNDPQKKRCQSFFNSLAELEPADRRRQIRKAIPSILSRLPHGTERIHVSWIEHLLENETAWVKNVLMPNSSQMESGPNIKKLPYALFVSLYCRVLGSLLPMPKYPPTEIKKDGTDLIAWSASRLQVGIVHFGCVGLAQLARNIDHPLLQQLKVSLVPPYNKKFIEALDVKTTSTKIWHMPKCFEASTKNLLFGLGAKALGSALSPNVRQCIAQRLPWTLGSVLMSTDTTTINTEEILALFRRADIWAQGGKL
ncbi:MAG: hypothetical protein V1754_10560, partial [Pseudomonadota bacterium]